MESGNARIQGGEVERAWELEYNASWSAANDADEENVPSARLLVLDGMLSKVNHIGF